MIADGCESTLCFQGLAAKGKNVSKRGPVGHSARSLGRSHPKRSRAKKSAVCLRKNFSVGAEGAGTGGQPGVCPLSPGTSRMRPQRRRHNPQNVCLLRARARVWASATQKCPMPVDNDSAPNRPVTFLYLPRAPLNPEPESKTWTQTKGETGNPWSPCHRLLDCLWLRAVGEERSSEKLGLFV